MSAFPAKRVNLGVVPVVSVAYISIFIINVYEYRDFLWYISLDQTGLKVTAAGDGESLNNLKQR